MSRMAVILTYALAVVACALIVVSIASAAGGASGFAGYLAALACFSLLLALWLHVCS